MAIRTNNNVLLQYLDLLNFHTVSKFNLLVLINNIYLTQLSTVIIMTVALKLLLHELIGAYIIHIFFLKLHSFKISIQYQLGVVLKILYARQIY